MSVSALSRPLVLASASRALVPSSERPIDKSAGKRRGCADYDPQGCVAFLRRVHPAKTAAGVAADTRISPRTVERWLSLEAQPSVPAFVRLVAAYGPAFLAAAVPGLAWVERAAALADHEATMIEIAALQARQARLERAIGSPLGEDQS